MKIQIALLLGYFFFAVSAMAGVEVTRSHHYGTDDKQIVDVYQPDACRKQTCPVVMWVHGGGWKNGDTSGERSTQMQTAWANNGIVMVGVNYRLSPDVQHPAHVQDVAGAINWVVNNIGQYGGDPRHISLLGHSAGAHLVALVATNPSYLGAYKLTPESALENVFPIDTASFDLTNPSRFVSRMIKSAFGTDEKVLREASPVWNVRKGERYPRFIIAAAKVRDDAVETSQQLEAKLRAVGASVDLVIVDYPSAGKLRAHGMIAKDLANMDADLTRRLIARVLSK